jgi:SIR2-like domain
MPDWAELTSALAKDAGTAQGTPPTIVTQRYEQRFGRVQLVEAIRESLHPDKARPGKAHRAFVQLPFDTVYTTNFDLLLEDAYSEATRPFRSLVGELQLPFHAGQIASSIVKMHGDLRHEEHIVVTKDDYDSFMERYPVVATHLSAMLITRTPLFVGYSLSDPDFENIRKIVRSRLGVFERMAYVVQFDVDPEGVEEALKAKLHIISLDSSSGGGRDDVLARFFAEIQSQLDTKAGVSLRGSRPDLFEDVETELVQKAVQTPQQSPVIETTSRLCFVMMPLSQRFDEVYRLLIAPVALNNGLTVLRADEMAGPGFIMEQIRTAVQQSRLCIADLTGSNPNVLYEVGYAQAAGKPLVLLAEEASSLPFDIAHQRLILYGTDLEAAKAVLQRAISIVLSSSRLQEAARLFDLAHYRGAIAAGAVVLEQRLREALAQRPPEKFARMSLGQMLRVAQQRRIVKGSLAARLAEVVTLRNRAVHEVAEPTKEEAQFVLDAIREVLDVLPEQE